MATKKKVTVEEPKVDYEDKLTYNLTVLEYDINNQVYNKVLTALRVPAHYKLTFGPGIAMPTAGRARQAAFDPSVMTKGSMLRVYDGTKQRAVIPNVLSFHETGHIELSKFPAS